MVLDFRSANRQFRPVTSNSALRLLDDVPASSDQPTLMQRLRGNGAEYTALFGKALALLSARDTHALAARLTYLAGRQVVLLAHTIDLAQLVQAFTPAAGRGVNVMVYADREQTLSGNTQGMIETLDELVRGNVHVHLSSGPNSGCSAMHQKAFLADDVAILGSTNWTSSSARNHEISALIELNANGATALDARVALVRNDSEPYTSQHSQQGTSHRDEQRRRRQLIFA